MVMQSGSATLSSDEQWSLGPLSVREILALPARVQFVDSGRALNLKRSTAYELLKQGRYPVPVLQQGRRYYVRRSDLLRHLDLTDVAAAG